MAMVKSYFNGVKPPQPPLTGGLLQPPFSTQIALIADSHGSLDRLEILLQNLSNQGIKHLLHAGDCAFYGFAEILAKFPQMQIWIALGNCDVNQEVVAQVKKLPHCQIESVVNCEINGIQFGISHIEGIAQSLLKNQDIQVFCHGHTHRAKIEKQNEKLVLNPGALCEDGKYFLISLPDFEVKQKRFDEN